MKIYLRITILVFIHSLKCVSLNSKDNSLSFDTVSNYKNWGWDALVIKNKFISVAVVPSMGGNILQYDFGTDTFLLLEPRAFGQSYQVEGSPFLDFYWGFGGLQTWPTPEVWPPAPSLTYRAFSFITECYNKDSVVLFLKSEVETTGLQFERRIIVYRNSTRVKIENTIVNNEPYEVTNGIMNVNYVSPSHLNETDYENFNINFPVNKYSKFQGGVYFSPGSRSFLGEIEPGIYKVQFYPAQGKVFADVRDGWASFIDKRDSQAYFKVFDVLEEESYPDNGARFEVYVQASDPAFMALEVISPMKNLSANGGKYTFTDNLYSSQFSQNLVYKANHAGATFGRLKYDSTSAKLNGTFGVFNQGIIRIVIFDTQNSVLQTSDSIKVYPDTAVFLDRILTLPANSNRIELQTFNDTGKMIGVLDYIDYSERKILENINSDSEEGYINLAIHGKQIHYDLKINKEGNVFIALYDINGKVVETMYSGFLKTGEYSMNYTVKFGKPGMYLLVCSGNERILTRKLIIKD